MTERDAFLKAIAADENNTNVRLVYADWLDEIGEHEEAERQRKWPQKKEWLVDICRRWNAGCNIVRKIKYKDLLVFGCKVSMAADIEIEISVDEDDIPKARSILEAIGDQLPEFWSAWSVVTGIPLKASLQQKSYVAPAWVCCPKEVYPESHLAGPRPERFIRAEMAQHEEKLREQMLPDKPFDSIQDNFEKDRP